MEWIFPHQGSSIYLNNQLCCSLSTPLYLPHIATPSLSLRVLSSLLFSKNVMKFSKLNFLEILKQSIIVEERARLWWKVEVVFIDYYWMGRRRKIKYSEAEAKVEEGISQAMVTAYVILSRSPIPHCKITFSTPGWGGGVFNSRLLRQFCTLFLLIRAFCLFL